MVLTCNHFPGDGIAGPQTMEAIVVDNFPVVNIQVAAIVRSQSELVPTMLGDNQEARPTDCKIIFPAEAGPSG